MLSDVALLVVGAIVGVAFSVIFEEPLLGVRSRVMRRISQVFQPSHSYGVPVQIRIGEREVPFVVLDTDDRSSYEPSTLHCRVDTAPISLPEEVLRIRDRVAQDEKKKRQNGHFYQWNGPTYGVRRFTRGRTGDNEALELNLWLGRSDWFTSIASNYHLDDVIEEDASTGQRRTMREKFLGSVDWSDPAVQPVPGFSNTLGVVVSLITRDHQLVVAKRPNDIGGIAGVHNVAINEGVHPDLDRSASETAPDIYRTVIRGASEELGIALNAADISLFAFGVSLPQYEWGILGSANCDLTFSELVDSRRTHSKDRNESHGLLAVPFNPLSVLTLISERDGWSPGALTCIYLALVREFGRSSVDRAKLRVSL